MSRSYNAKFRVGVAGFAFLGQESIAVISISYDTVILSGWCCLPRSVVPMYISEVRCEETTLLVVSSHCPQASVQHEV